MKRVSTEPPPQLLEFGVPEAVADVVGRALAKAPEGRQSTAAQFANELASAVKLVDADGRQHLPVPSTVQIPELPPHGVDTGPPRQNGSTRRKLLAATAALIVAAGATFLIVDNLETPRPVVNGPVGTETATLSPSDAEPTSPASSALVPVTDAATDVGIGPESTATPDPLVARRQAALDRILVNYPGVRGTIISGDAVLEGTVADETERELLDQTVRAAGLDVQNNVLSSDAGSPTAPVGYSLNDLIGAQPELSTLRALLDQAGLSAALDSGGGVTLFAPTNDAFTLIQDQVDQLKGDPAALQDVLRYHLLVGTQSAAAISTATSLPTQLADETIEVDVSGPNIILNGTSPVLVTDALASNGVMHIVGQVLLPDAGG